MTAIDRLRRTLTTSSRWERLIKGIPLMTLATAPLLPVEDFNHTQMVDVARWITGRVPEEPAPAVLLNYINRLTVDKHHPAVPRDIPLEELKERACFMCGDIFLHCEGMSVALCRKCELKRRY